MGADTDRESRMRIAVLGSGAGGTAVAFDCASHGHEVRLFDFPRFAENIDPIAGAGTITADGDIAGTAPVAYSGHDIGEALDGADLVYVVGPAYSTEPFGEAVRGRLTAGQTVIVSPSSCGGALAFRRAARLGRGRDAVRLAETSTLPYAVRVVKPGSIRVFLKLRAGNLLAALPGSETASVLESIADVYPGMEPARNVLQTSLQNANPVIHPAVTLANAARIEGTGGDFLFYEEGVTDSVGRLIEALDGERIAIGRALGLDIRPDPEMGVRQGYMREANYGSGYREAPGFRGIGAQPALNHRYLNEDVGYGLVFMARLGDQAGVATPMMDAVIRLASVLMAHDYTAEGRRTPETLGIGALGPDDLEKKLG